MAFDYISPGDADQDLANQQAWRWNQDWSQASSGFSPINYDPDPYDQTDQNRDWNQIWSGANENTSGGGFWNDVVKAAEGLILQGAGSVGNAITNAAGNGGGLAALLPMYYASQRAASEMREQAGRYGQLGREAADRADPFGDAERQKYKARLDTLIKDPTTSPVYQSMMREAMSSLGPQVAAAGGAGTMQGGGDWARTIGDVANKYTGEWADRYGRWAGGDFNPAHAGQLLMQGGQLQGQQEMAALAASLYPMGALASILGGGGAPGTAGGPPGSSGGSSPTSGVRPPTPGTNTTQTRPGTTTNNQPSAGGNAFNQALQLARSASGLINWGLDGSFSTNPDGSFNIGGVSMNIGPDGNLTPTEIGGGGAFNPDGSNFWLTGAGGGSLSTGIDDPDPLAGMYNIEYTPVNFLDDIDLGNFFDP